MWSSRVSNSISACCWASVEWKPLISASCCSCFEICLSIWSVSAFAASACRFEISFANPCCSTNLVTASVYCSTFSLPWMYPCCSRFQSERKSLLTPACSFIRSCKVFARFAFSTSSRNFFAAAFAAAAAAWSTAGTAARGLSTAWVSRFLSFSRSSMVTRMRASAASPSLTSGIRKPKKLDDAPSGFNVPACSCLRATPSCSSTAPSRARAFCASAMPSRCAIAPPIPTQTVSSKPPSFAASRIASAMVFIPGRRPPTALVVALPKVVLSSVI